MPKETYADFYGFPGLAKLLLEGNDLGIGSLSGLLAVTGGLDSGRTGCSGSLLFQFLQLIVLVKKKNFFLNESTGEIFLPTFISKSSSKLRLSSKNLDSDVDLSFSCASSAALICCFAASSCFFIS